MSEVTDKELVKIVYVFAADYQPEAVEAAKYEIDKRNLSSLQIDELKVEISVNRQQEASKAEMPLQTYWKVLTFVFPGVLNLVFAMLFAADGYDKRTKEMWKWTLYGFCFYVVLVLFVTMN